MITSILLEALRNIRNRFRRERNAALFLILTLAVGIALNAAVFSAVKSVLLTPLPYPEPDSLVALKEKRDTHPNGNFPFAPEEVVGLIEQKGVFSGIAAYRFDEITLARTDNPEIVPVAIVSSGFFDVLNVRPLFGRTFVPSDDEWGGNIINAVISESLWRRLGSGPDVIDSLIPVDAGSICVVGVVPQISALPTLIAPQKADVWVASPLRGNNISHSVMAFGRLQHGVTIESAQSAVDVFAANFALARPDMSKGHGVYLRKLSDSLMGQIERPLLLLWAAVLAVILLACANWANMTIASWDARRGELALRMALGATPGRVTAVILMENTLLALFGAALGIVLTRWILMAFLPYAVNIPGLEGAGIDLTVCAFAAGLSILCAILFGLPVLLSLRKTNLTEQLWNSRAAGASIGSGKMRGILLTLELALTVALVVNGTALARGTLNLLSTADGFDKENLITVQVPLPGTARYSQARDVENFYSNVIGRLEALPQIKSVAATSNVPLTGLGSSGVITDEMPPTPMMERTVVAGWRTVTPGYFHAIGIPLIAGRFFDDSDITPSSSLPVIINDTLRRRFWESPQEAIGRRIDGGVGKWLEIVGVVGDVVPFPGGAYMPEINFPLAQLINRNMTLVMRTDGRFPGLMNHVAGIVHEQDGAVPLGKVRTMDEVIISSVELQYFITFILNGFSFVALFLAAAGIYGVSLYVARRRYKEYGIRMAIGATRSSILFLALRESLKAVFAGMVFGIGLTLLLSKLIARHLFGVSGMEVTTLVITVAVVALVSVLAGLLPALKAAMADPNLAIRSD